MGESTSKSMINSSNNFSMVGSRNNMRSSRIGVDKKSAIGGPGNANIIIRDEDGTDVTPVSLMVKSSTTKTHYKDGTSSSAEISMSNIVKVRSKFKPCLLKCHSNDLTNALEKFNKPLFLSF